MKIVKSIIITSLLVLFPISKEARLKAQWVVTDPANLAQNILAAIRALQSNINEASMIANQVRQLSNDLKNLTKLPYSIVNEYTSDVHELFSAVGKVHGLMQDFAGLEANFDTLYPDFNNSANLIPGATISQKSNEWLNQSREMMLQASLTGAKVLENLPRKHDRLDKLLVDSSNSVGILQAAQAGNQISAEVASNLTNLSAQLATYTQAHTSFLMQVNSSSASAKNRMDHVLDGYKRSRHPGVPLNSY